LIALDSLYELRTKVPTLIESSEDTEAQGQCYFTFCSALADLNVSISAWRTFWLPLLLTIAKHSVNGSRDIRQRAIGYLQRVLLSSQLIPGTDQEAALTAVFERVLFPVVEELLKPQVYNQDPPGMEETRLRASALICKVFLQYLGPLARQHQEILEVFLRIIDLLERFMRTGSRQQVSARFDYACQHPS
jgi:brefeldin A-resistance guanine nucleotide exchange factor 1